jgi:hypothetical protein
MLSLVSRRRTSRQSQRAQGGARLRICLLRSSWPFHPKRDGLCAQCAWLISDVRRVAMHTEPTIRREARPLRKWLSTVGPPVSWPSRRPRKRLCACTGPWRCPVFRSIDRMSGSRFERDSALPQNRRPFVFRSSGLVRETGSSRMRSAMQGEILSLILDCENEVGGTSNGSRDANS